MGTIISFIFLIFLIFLYFPFSLSLRPLNQKQRSKVCREILQLIGTRHSKMCNFLDWRSDRIIYKRYEESQTLSFYFIIIVKPFFFILDMRVCISLFVWIEIL